MRKSLLILAALIAFGGISAQAQGPKSKLDKERKEKKEWKANLPQNPLLAKQNSAKDGPLMPADNILSVTPAMPLQFTFDKCDDVKSRPLVIKNPTDETIDAFIMFQNEADIELGDTVFEEYDNWNNRYILNYFEINGFGYAANGDDPYLVKTNLATGSQIEKWCEDGYRGLAYDGNLFWTASGNYLIALDANLNPTGRQINVGYNACVAFDGTNLITLEYDNSPARVKAFDTNGNLVADYGTFIAGGYGLTYDPNTGLFWVAIEGSAAFRLADGKANLEAVLYYGCVVVGFDTDGLPFMMDYSNNGILRKATKFSTYPKGISLSQSAISLKPGETVTVNVTASIEHGLQSETMMCMNLANAYSSIPYFVRPVEFAYNIEPEFVATASAQFSAFAGYNAVPQTVWIKNTGCAPIIFDEEPTLDGGDYFSIGNLITPNNFSGLLLAGDSIGAVIGFYSDDTGNYTDKLIITTENTEPIEISLSATAAELDYTIPNDVVTATINCGANTATASCNIANNSGVTMSIGKATATVVLDIYLYSCASEVSLRVQNAQGTIFLDVPEYTYSTSQHYVINLELPKGKYTIVMGDRCSDTWDSGGYMDVTVDGVKIIDHAQPIYGQYYTNVYFEVNTEESATIANGATINQLTLPLAALEIGDITELPVYFEGIANAVASIAVETAAGQGELVVGNAIDCGESIVNNSAFKLFEIANSGCGTLSLSSVSIDEASDFMFYFVNSDENLKTVSNIEIAPKETLKLTVRFFPSQTGARTGTITITPAEGTPATIQLTGTGINEPEYPVFAYEGEGLGFVLDTVGCSQTNFTLKGRIANDGEADLVVTEPIAIIYQAGKVNKGWFEIDMANGDYIDDWSYSSFDNIRYMQLEEGDYELRVNNYTACDGKIVIKSGSKTLLTANVADADANCNPYFNFTVSAADLAKHTVEPGDTLDLEINICPRSYNTGLQIINYPIVTNDPDEDYVPLPAKVRIVKEPKLVFPEVIDFGEVTVDQWTGKWLTWEDKGCGEYEIDNKWVPTSGSAFEYYYEEGIANLWFEPTSVGTFQDIVKIAISYYYDGTKQVKDTFNVTLKGVGVASPSIVLPGELPTVTAEKDATTVTVTVPVGNSSTATALKLTDANMAVITLNSGTGSSYSSSYWNLYRITEHGEEYVIEGNSGYFNASGQQKTEVVSMPAGDYRLYMYNSYSSSRWNGGFVSIKTFDGIELLGETRNPNSYSEYNVYFSVAERNTDVTVAPATATANGTANVVFDIPVKGLAAGEYYFGRVYNTNDASNPEIYIEVKVVIEDDFAYEYSKEEVEFTQVHTGVRAYSSVMLRNLGTVGLDIDGITLKDRLEFDIDGDYNNNYVAVGDSLKVSLSFNSGEAGTFRDTLYVGIYNPLKDEYVTDTLPLVAVANNTQVISVSTPNSRYAVAGDVIDINVTFDAPVIAVEDENLASMPKLLMNTNSFAELDSIGFDKRRDDLYTLTFHYPVVKADNVALFDYKEDTVYLNGHIVADIVDFELNKVQLPAVGTLASTFPVTIDNKTPQLVDSVFDLSLADMTLSFSIKFSEPVTGLNENCISLTGATLVSLTTKDNITYSAVVELEHCVDIVVDIDATLKDLAGNAKKISESKKIPAIHSYTATVVAPTCTAEGYTTLTCSLCNHQEKANVVAATGHTPGAAVKENETADGYDEVVYCTVCHAELSREHKSTTAIAENAASLHIYGLDRAIVVETAEANGAEICVFDISGRAIAKALANSNRTVIAMPEAGLYVVRIGQQSEKVVLQ